MTSGPLLFPSLALLGLGVGVIAGMFGIGGGFVLTPLLHTLFAVPLPIAVGSSLCQNIGTAVASLLRHREYRHGELRVDLVMLGGGLFGVDAGTRALHLLVQAGAMHIGGRAVPVATLVLDAAYALVLLGAALFSLRPARSAVAPALAQRAVPGSVAAGPGSVVPPPVARLPPLCRLRIPPYVALPAVGIASASAPVMAYVGFVTGTLSGLLGVGGGVVLLPVLVYGYGFSLKHAAGTGIVLLLATVLMGTLENALRGQVDLRLALCVLAGSSLGAQLGARATAHLSNRTLRRCFCGLLLATVAAIAVGLVRALRG